MFDQVVPNGLGDALGIGTRNLPTSSQQTTSTPQQPQTKPKATTQPKPQPQPQTSGTTQGTEPKVQNTAQLEQQVEESIEKALTAIKNEVFFDYCLATKPFNDQYRAIIKLTDLSHKLSQTNAFKDAAEKALDAAKKFPAVEDEALKNVHEAGECEPAKYDGFLEQYNQIRRQGVTPDDPAGKLTAMTALRDEMRDTATKAKQAKQPQQPTAQQSQSTPQQPQTKPSTPPQVDVNPQNQQSVPDLDLGQLTVAVDQLLKEVDPLVTGERLETHKKTRKGVFGQPAAKIRKLSELKEVLEKDIAEGRRFEVDLQRDTEPAKDIIEKHLSGSAFEVKKFRDRWLQYANNNPPASMKERAQGMQKLLSDLQKKTGTPTGGTQTQINPPTQTPPPTSQQSGKQGEEIAAKKKAEEEARKLKEEQERQQKEKEAAAKAEQERLAKEAAAKKKAEEEAAARKKVEEARKLKEEQERQQKEKEAAAKAEQERLAKEAAAKKKAEEEAAARKKEEEARKLKEEQERQQKEKEAAAKAEQERLAKEAAAKKKAEEEAAARKKEEEARKLKEEQERQRKEKEAAAKIVSKPSTEEQIKKLNLSPKQRETREALKTRPVVANGVTSALEGIAAMIDEAEATAGETRAQAKSKIERAEAEASKADEDSRKAAGEIQEAAQGVAQADSDLRNAKEAIENANLQIKAALQREFDARKAALRALADEVVEKKYNTRGNVDKYLSQIDSVVDPNFKIAPPKAFDQLDQFWKTLHSFFEDVPPTAQSKLDQAKEQAKLDKAAAEQQKADAEGRQRDAQTRKSAAESRKRQAEADQREADTQKRRAEAEKTNATQESDSAGSIVDEARAKAQVAAAKVTDALRFGPASRTPVDPDSIAGLSPKQKSARRKLAEDREKATAAVMRSFKDYPELATSALDAIQEAEHPEAFLGGIEKVGKLLASNFGGQATSLLEAQKMAKNALKMAGLVGGDYVDRMAKYYGTDAAKNKDELRGEDAKRTSLNYTNALGDAMLGADGTIKPSGAKFEGIRNNLHFHPDSLKNPMPNLARHLENFCKNMKDPTTGAACEKAMKSITKAPQGGAMPLVKSTLGLTGSATAGVKEARKAVLSAALTPLTQGPVGSCFATCNCMDYQESNPGEFMGDLAQIVNTGELKKGQDAVPVVQKIPPGENGLLRSFEYTVATLGARDAHSGRKQGISTKVNNGLVAVQNSDAYKKLSKSEVKAEKDLEEAELVLKGAKEKREKARLAYNTAAGASTTAFTEYSTSVDEYNAADREYVAKFNETHDDNHFATKRLKTKREEKQAEMNRKKTALDRKETAVDEKKRLYDDEIQKVSEATMKVEEARTKVNQAAADKSLKCEALKLAAAGAVTWEYDPTMTGGGTAADGTSTQGGWVMQRASDRRPIESESELKDCLKVAFKAALGDDGDDAEIEKVIKSGGFLNVVKEVKAGEGSVFQHRTGGQEKDSKSVLTGKKTETTDLVTPDENASEGEKTKALLSTLVSSLKDSNDETVTLGVEGVHAERALPKHPSLDALKSGGNVEANVEAVFAKSKERATTPMDEEQVTHLVGKSVGAVLSDFLGDGREIFSSPLPSGKLKPGELKAQILASVSEKSLKEAYGKNGQMSAEELEKTKARLGKKLDSFLIKELFPQFVIADTNWGDATGKTFHVVAPDLTTGEPKLFTKNEATGELTAEGTDFTAKSWKATTTET